MTTVKISEELKAHIEFNSSANVYRHIPSEFNCVGGRWGMVIQWDKVKDYHLSEAIRNIDLIKKRIEARRQIATIQTGDFIKYKDGHLERVTHVWGDSAQAGGGQASFYMAKSGSASYSGGLNSGLPLDKLKYTNESKDGLFWLFSDDSSGGSRGINFLCPVRIWEEI